MNFTFAVDMDFLQWFACLATSRILKSTSILTRDENRYNAAVFIRQAFYRHIVAITYQALTFFSALETISVVIIFFTMRIGKRGQLKIFSRNRYKNKNSGIYVRVLALSEMIKIILSIFGISTIIVIFIITTRDRYIFCCLYPTRNLSLSEW